MSSELTSNNTTQSKFKPIFDEEAKKGYNPSTHDDATPATIGDIKYLIEIYNIRHNHKKSS